MSLHEQALGANQVRVPLRMACAVTLRFYASQKRTLPASHAPAGCEAASCMHCRRVCCSRGHQLGAQKGGSVRANKRLCELSQLPFSNCMNAHTHWDLVRLTAKASSPLLHAQGMAVSHRHSSSDSTCNDSSCGSSVCGSSIASSTGSRLSRKLVCRRPVAGYNAVYARRVAL